MKHLPIGKILSLLSRQNQKYLTRELKAYEIGGGGQHSFLMEVIKHPGINQDQLTADLRFDKATTARSIKQLEAAGYIKRKVCEDDRRVYLLFPTQKAVDFFPNLKEILLEANRTLTENLSAQEVKQLYELLKKMAEDN